MDACVPASLSHACVHLLAAPYLCTCVFFFPEEPSYPNLLPFIVVLGLAFKRWKNEEQTRLH